MMSEIKTPDIIVVHGTHRSQPFNHEPTSEHISRGIAEYLRTRERPASMASLFGSSELFEDEIETPQFRKRASTFNHLNAATRKQRNSCMVENKYRLSEYFENRGSPEDMQSSFEDGVKSRSQGSKKKEDKRDKKAKIESCRNYFLKLFKIK